MGSRKTWSRWAPRRALPMIFPQLRTYAVFEGWLGIHLGCLGSVEQNSGLRLSVYNVSVVKLMLNSGTTYVFASMVIFWSCSIPSSCPMKYSRSKHNLAVSSSEITSLPKYRVRKTSYAAESESSLLAHMDADAMSKLTCGKDRPKLLRAYGDALPSSYSFASCCGSTLSFCKLASGR